MSDVLRAIAGMFMGAGSLLLIWLGIESGDTALAASGTTLLGTMAGFFIGEENGKRKTS